MDITPRDLVIVVRPTHCKCGDNDGVGYPFEVLGVVCSDWSCDCCGYYHESPEMMLEFAPDNWIEARRCIKCDPPATEEQQEMELAA